MIVCEGNRCAVRGAITLANATALLAESEPLFAREHTVVDLGAVTELDSAAVSLLLEWRRQAEKTSRRIEYVNLPSNLKSLAELYGVSHLLGLV